MKDTLNKKNEFVVALREHLQSKYQTKHHYTFGEGDFEGREEEGAYCLVRKGSNEPKDISGFCFRKDLCSWAPQSETDMLGEVHNFASGNKNLESALGNGGKSLEIRFDGEKYMVSAYIDEGHAGEISLSFVKSPSFEIAA